MSDTALTYEFALPLAPLAGLLLGGLAGAAGQGHGRRARQRRFTPAGS